MADFNQSTVQVDLKLTPPYTRDYITLPKRDLEAKQVSYEAFRDFCQHFLYTHNCCAFYKLGLHNANIEEPVFVVLDVSNRVLCAVTENVRDHNLRLFNYAIDVAKMLHERETD